MKKIFKKCKVIPGVEIDGEIYIEGEDVTIKIHPKILHGGRSVEYILNFEKEFIEHFNEDMEDVLDMGFSQDDISQHDIKGIKERIKEDLKDFESRLVTVTKTIKKIMEEQRRVLKKLENME